MTPDRKEQQEFHASSLHVPHRHLSFMLSRTNTVVHYVLLRKLVLTASSSSVIGIVAKLLSVLNKDASWMPCSGCIGCPSSTFASEKSTSFKTLGCQAPQCKQEKDNEYVKLGKKHYSDAIDCYTRAINQKALSDSESSILFSNRAHVNLQLGNNRRALLDAEEAIKLSPTYAKAYYRAVKASMSLKLLAEAESYCQKGLVQFPDNEELKKLLSQIHLQKSENERHELQVSKALAAAKV